MGLRELPNYWGVSRRRDGRKVPERKDVQR